MSVSASTSKQALLDLVNTDNGTDFVAADINISTISTYKPTSEDDTRNSRATLTGVSETKYPGSVEVMWTRRSPYEVFDNAPQYWYQPDADEDDVRTWIHGTFLVNRPIPFDVDSYTATVKTLEEDDPNSKEGLFQFSVTMYFDKHHILKDAFTFFLSTKHKSLSQLVPKYELDGFTEDATKE